MVCFQALACIFIITGKKRNVNAQKKDFTISLQNNRNVPFSFTKCSENVRVSVLTGMHVSGSI